MADPFAGLEEVTLPAAAAPAGSEAFAGLEEADDLDLRDEADFRALIPRIGPGIQLGP